MQVAELARRLEAEGLLRPERRRPLPAYPERIAVVTSPRGKAVHDVLRTLRRRYPMAEVLVAGVAVEGAGASGEIVAGLRAAAQVRPDVILLVRGGGSYEDLMPFNAEEVARAVAECPVPVVTGIGHEPDTSIADMVADASASTPTAAAERCAPAATEVARALDKDRRALGRALAHRVQSARHRLTLVASRPVLRDARAALGPAQQALDLAAMRLRRSIPGRLERNRARLDAVRDRLRAVAPGVTAGARHTLALSAARLEDLSPLRILARGYAAVFAVDGGVVSSVGMVTCGDRVVVRVSDGRLGCVVEDVEPEGRIDVG